MRSPTRTTTPPRMPRSARKWARTSFPIAVDSRSMISFPILASGSSVRVTPACTRSSFRSTSTWYCCAISSRNPWRPRRAFQRRATGPRRSCGPRRRSSPPLLQARQVLHNELAVGIRVEVRLDQLRRGRDREVHGLAPQLEDRLQLLRVDLLLGPRQQLFVLLARLREQRLALLLRHAPCLGDHLLRLGFRRGDHAPVLLQQPRRLGASPLRLLELLLDAALPVLHRLEDRRPAEPPQQGQENPEDDERPEDQPGVDGKG